MAAVVVAGVVFLLNQDATPSAQTGDCIKVNDVEKADIDTVGCDDEQALYKVAITRDDAGATCPGPAYVAYTQTGGGDLLLCLTLNAKEGDCFKREKAVDVPVDCAKGAEFQVTKVIAGSDDPKQCAGAGASALAPYTYPEPKLTLCRAAPSTTAS